MARLVSRRVFGLVATAIVAAAIAFPLGALASHQFTDVPTSSTYHNDIDAIRDAGITTGCGLNLYCPKDFVTREQMAAFLNRLGALQAGKTPVVNADKLDGLTSSQFARSDLTQHYSCAGPNMDPLQSDTEYWGTSSYRYLFDSADYLTCAVHLPDGATVTGFAADVYDPSDVYETACGLVRVPSTSDATVLANTPSSGATPGYTTLVDATIATPVIDNGTYAYSAHCYISGGGNLGGVVQVFKVTVSYTGAP